MSRTRVQLGGGTLETLGKGLLWLAGGAATGAASSLLLDSQKDFEDGWTNREVFYDRMRVISRSFELVNMEISQCPGYYKQPSTVVFKSTWKSFSAFYKDVASSNWLWMTDGQAQQARNYAAQAVYWARRVATELPGYCPDVKLYFTIADAPPLSPEEGSVKQQVAEFAKQTADIEKAKGTFNWERALQWGGIIVLATAGIVAIRFAAGFQRR